MLLGFCSPFSGAVSPKLIQYFGSGLGAGKTTVVMGFLREETNCKKKYNETMLKALKS